MGAIGHWTAGKPVEGTSGRKGPIFDPASGEQTAEVMFASHEEVDAAVRAASELFSSGPPPRSAGEQKRCSPSDSRQAPSGGGIASTPPPHARRAVQHIQARM